MLKKLVVLAVLFILIAVIFSGYIGTSDRVSVRDDTPGSQGISWSDMVPLEKTTFVGYDPESYLDDYAYLAAVPASVFYSEQNKNMYSNPLLFYEAPYETSNDEERVFNANQGIQYFMQDWLTYNEGEFDNVQFINMNDGDIEVAKAISNSRSYTVISGGSSAEVARNIALENWEYSDGAVVAIVEEDYDMEPILTTNKFPGKTPSATVEYGVFEGEAEPDPVNPIYHPFTIAEDYKYIVAHMTWGEDYNPIADITERGKDPDLQLYDEQLGEVAASEEWNVLSGASEHIGSYVYNSGDWKAAVTYMPTESMLKPEDSQEGYTTVSDEPETRGSEELDKNNGQAIVSEPDKTSVGDGPAIPNPFSSTVKYTIEYTLYPGVDLPLPEDAPYGCRNAHFNLYWSDSTQDLGLIVRSSSGAEIATALDPGDTQSIEIPELGEGQYSVAVINLNDNAVPVDFEVEYVWEQTLEDNQCDGLASASEGAVFASTQNIPLLFTSPRKVNDATIEALDTLGITKVYLVDLGGQGKSSLAKDLESSRSLLQENLEVEHITSYEKIYNMIRESTKYNGTYQNDIVFTTLNPWSYWQTTEGLKGEQAKGFYIGPATFAAAHHGSPVFITESDARLSNAQAWHNQFWRSAWNGRYPPSVGCMVLTARDVYEVLDDYGFDYQDKQESILTVAGQFDIGTTWDRMLVGAATTGRIEGSPVDSAYWVARSMFYQSMIFANPAVSPELDENDGKRITGSRSLRVAGVLNIAQDEMEVEVEYPVAQTWVSYNHRFNERGGKYWGSEYVTATGITPFYDISDNPSMDIGGVWPDMTTSEIVPHYLDQAGYSSVFTTNFQATMENLNRGAIMWLEVMHGGNSGSGIVGFWDENQLEPNPWRGYEENAFTLRGSTADPDVVSMNKQIGLDLQPGGSPIIDGGPRRESHDGVVIAIAQQAQTVSFNGIDFDNALENLHSMGMNAGSCLIANSYLHLSLIRHGSVFQVIDPWLTSWYSAFAIETFTRDLVLGYNVGQAYERGIKHVGIQYLTEHWWWDIFENVVYFGDPDLRVFSPMHEWERPRILKRTLAIEGHSPSNAVSHPYSIKDTTVQEAGLYAGIVIIPLAVIVVAMKRKKNFSFSLKKLRMSKN